MTSVHWNLSLEFRRSPWNVEEKQKRLQTSLKKLCLSLLSFSKFCISRFGRHFQIELLRILLVLIRLFITVVV